MTATTVAMRRKRQTYEQDPRRYRIMRWIIIRLMRLLYRYELQGEENVPARGPTILAVNHLHFVDPGAVVPAVSRMIVTLAAEKWEKNVLWGAFLRAAGVVFVRRGEVDREALRGCLAVLNRGGVLAVAPEGTRSRTGTMQRAKAGIAYLAVRTDAIIVPLAFWGTEKLSDWLRLHRPTCHVRVGKPFRLPPSSDKPSNEQLLQWSDDIMVHIGSMMPAAYRGVYAQRIARVEAGQEPMPTFAEVVP